MVINTTKMNVLLGELHQERVGRMRNPYLDPVPIGIVDPDPIGTVDVEYTIPIRRPTKKAPVPIATPIPEFTEEEADILNRLQAVVDGFDPAVWKHKERVVEKGKQYKDTDFISKHLKTRFGIAVSYFKGHIASVREPKIAIEKRTEVIVQSPAYIEMEARMMAENPAMPRRSLIAKLKKEVIQKDHIIKLLQKQLRHGIKMRHYWFNSYKAMAASIPAILKSERSAFLEKISEKTRETLIVQCRAAIDAQIAKDPDCPCCLNAIEFNTLAIKDVDFCDETIGFKCHNVCVQCAPKCIKCPICRQ
jgi:hypothetical protein